MFSGAEQMHPTSEHRAFHTAVHAPNHIIVNLNCHIDFTTNKNQCIQCSESLHPGSVLSAAGGRRQFCQCSTLYIYIWSVTRGRGHFTSNIDS